MTETIERYFPYFIKNNNTIINFNSKKINQITQFNKEYIVCNCTNCNNCTNKKKILSINER